MNNHRGSHAENVVPISLDIQLDGMRLIDTFLWDIHGQITCEAFAAAMVADLGLSPSFARPIALSISRQLRFIDNNVFPEGNTLGHKKLLRIEVDVHFKSVRYREVLQWDASCSHNSPEMFARQTVADLMLPQELEPAIAFAIHQQLLAYRFGAEAVPSLEVMDGQSQESFAGPRLSIVQPTDQYDLNTHDWRVNRPVPSG